MTDEQRAKKIAADTFKVWLESPRLLVTVGMEELLRRAILAALKNKSE